VDAWLTPWAGRSKADLAALREGHPLHAAGSVWLSLDPTLFELRGDPSGGRLEGARAFTLSSGRLRGAWASAGLRWDGARWITGSGAEIGPWDALPAPDALAERVGSLPPGERTWEALRADTSPAATAERAARWSRTLACGPAAVVGAALCALAGPGAAGVLLAALPVLAWESLATLAQAQAAAGSLPPWATAAVRLLVAVLATGLLVRRMGRC
jgi:hypothetical protein